MGLITDVIASLRRGAADRAASELLAKVVQAVQATGKKGSVTIKLEVSMLKGGETEMEVKAKLSHSAPVEDIPMGIYYPDEKGALHRDNPRQLELLGEDGKTINLRDRRMGVSGDDL